MAAKSQRNPRGRAKAEPQSSAPQRGNAAQRNRSSLLLFAVAVFLLFVLLIPGKSAWNWLHRSILGLHGFLTFLWPFLLGFAAVTLVLERPIPALRGRVWPSVGMMIAVGALIDVIATSGDGEAFWTHLASAFQAGGRLSGGGFFGALCGYPLYLLFGKAGAIVTVALLIFVFFMLVTRIPMTVLYRLMSKPAKKLGETGRAMYDAHQERRSARFDVDVPIDNARFDIDVPIAGENRGGEDGGPVQPEEEPIGEKRRRVLDACRDGEEAPPAPEGKSAQTEKPARVRKQAEKSAEDAAEKPRVPEGPGITMSSGEGYRTPPFTLLKKYPEESMENINRELVTNGQRLVDILRSFGVDTRVTGSVRGPAVTRYELQPAAGVKISRITNLADDIALNLAADSVRIETHIPGKTAMGIEVPNETRSTVGLRDLLESSDFRSAKGSLPCVLGKDITGKICIMDIAKMPHVLIAGTTGSGKSVCLNSIIVSLLYKHSPSEVKMLMIDPKAVEMKVYNGIPHLLVPVVTDARKASGALGWAVTEMLRRYQLMSENNVRNLEGYNELCQKNDTLTPLPQIVIIIDELADLMMAAPNEVEDSICRLAQMARAAGMHLVIATQRPSTDVITGLIKSNIPSRIALTVSTQIDSRVIHDMAGAEKLIGKGDMLYCPVGQPRPRRVQGCWVSDGEIEAVSEFLRGEEEAAYDEEVIQEIERQAAAEKSSKGGASADDEGVDSMLQQAIECVVEAGQASTTLLQKRLKLGYARASRIIDQLADRKIIGPYEGSKPRQVLISRQQWLEMQASGVSDGEE